MVYFFHYRNIIVNGAKNKLIAEEDMKSWRDKEEVFFFLFRKWDREEVPNATLKLQKRRWRDKEDIWKAIGIWEGGKIKKKK